MREGDVVNCHFLGLGMQITVSSSSGTLTVRSSSFAGTSETETVTTGVTLSDATFGVVAALDVTHGTCPIAFYSDPLRTAAPKPSPPSPIPSIPPPEEIIVVAPTAPFTPSATFTPNGTFTPSPGFTPSAGFTPTSPFTPPLYPFRRKAQVILVTAAFHFLVD
jgi:hypothetical protein